MTNKTFRHLALAGAMLAALAAAPALATTYVLTDLGTLGGNYSAAYGVNDAGQVVGYGYTTGGDTHAFLYSDGVMTDLGTLGGRDSYTQGINDTGQVVGYSYTTGNAAEHAFLYSDGTIANLGTLGGRDSLANGINDAGDIIGYSQTTGGVQHAFLYSDGAMTDLNGLIDPDLGWTLNYASAINNLGQIVGYGTIGNATRAFLLTPTAEVPAVPEPATWALMLAGFGAVGCALRRRGTATPRRVVA